MRRSLILLMLITLPHISAAKNILIVGDSHSCANYGFGPALYNALAKNNSVTMYCTESSTPNYWLKGGLVPHHSCWTYTGKGERQKCQGNGAIPPLNSILASKHYDEAVIALGTNSEGKKTAPPSYAALADLLAVQHVRCNWVSPPTIRPDEVHSKHKKTKARVAKMQANTDDFYKSLKASVGKSCPVIDSRKMTAAGSAGGEATDGIHRSPEAGVAWAKGVYAQLFHQPLSRAAPSLMAGDEEAPQTSN